MPTLYCFNDEEGVGRALVAAARDRKNWSAHLFNKPADIPKAEGYVFVWPSPGAPNAERDKATYRQLIHLRPELKRIQSMLPMAVHNDKIGQATRWSPRWIPKTYVSMSAARAHDALAMLKVPFISKSSHGHNGQYVRAILTEQNALLEIAQVFGELKTGIPGNIVQRDYLLWQVLVPHNPFSYRVIRVGHYFAIQRRYKVSAANFTTEYTEPVNELDGEANDMIFTASRFLDEIRAPFCAVDLLYGNNSDVLVLGTTMNWRQDELNECRFHGKSGYRGQDVWQLLLDQIGDGVFDVSAT